MPPGSPSRRTTRRSSCPTGPCRSRSGRRSGAASLLFAPKPSASIEPSLRASPPNAGANPPAAAMRFITPSGSASTISSARDGLVVPPASNVAVTDAVGVARERGQRPAEADVRRAEVVGLRERELLVPADDLPALVRRAVDPPRALGGKPSSPSRSQRAWRSSLLAVLDHVGDVDELPEPRRVPARDARLDPVVEAELVERDARRPSSGGRRRPTGTAGSACMSRAIAWSTLPFFQSSTMRSQG